MSTRQTVQRAVALGLPHGPAANPMCGRAKLCPPVWPCRPAQGHDVREAHDAQSGPCRFSPKPFRVPLFAARTLNATGQFPVILSLQ